MKCDKLIPGWWCHALFPLGNIPSPPGEANSIFQDWPEYQLQGTIGGGGEEAHSVCIQYARNTGSGLKTG